MDNAQVTQVDIDAWEIYGPKIFNCEMTGPEALARHRLERSEPVKEARYTLITLARIWWQRKMNSHCRSVSIKGDGRVDVHWSDNDESGSYTLPVDFVSEVLPTTPPEPVAEIERLREALEPFALMHREGVAQPHSDRPKYTTVTTCIVYFERAAAALGDAS